MVSCVPSCDQLLWWWSQIYWEWNDETGLWQAFCNDVRKSIETNYLDQVNTFTLGDPELSHHYNLATFSRTHPRSKLTQRLRRTPNIWDRPEGERLVFVWLHNYLCFVGSTTCGAFRLVGVCVCLSVCMCVSVCACVCVCVCVCAQTQLI